MGGFNSFMSTLARSSRVAGVGTDWAALLMGAGLGLTVALQVSTLQRSDINGVYPLIDSFSRLCALVGSYFALVGVLLVARIPWVEQGVGHDRLVTWHRKLGPYALFLIGFHVLFVVFGYAGVDQIPLYEEFWRVLNNFPWMWWALLGFVLMLSAGFSSYKKARAKMSYETWWLIHIYFYLAIAVSFMHQILSGPMFANHPLNKAYWTGLYLFVLFAVVYWRIGIPVWRSIYHNLKVDRVIVEGPGIISIVMRGRKLNKLAAEGGQFFGWRFLQQGQFLVSHPYSLSAAPTEHFMRITIKDLGDHSHQAAFIKPGTRVMVEGPYGAFTAGRATSPHVVLVGGGVGITPIRAIMEEFKQGVQMDVIFRASKEEDLVLKEELDYMAYNSGGTIRIHYLVGPRSKFPMDAKMMLKLCPYFPDSDIYICGPEPLVEAVREAAQKAGVPKNRFHDEAFNYLPD
jgi:predicted ferric reductase